MKDKIMLFVIGVLVGAVISTGAFYVYTTTNSSCNCNNQNTQMNNGEQPPEKPDGDNGSQPPEKPSDDNQQNNNTQNNN